MEYIQKLYCLKDSIYELIMFRDNGLYYASKGYHLKVEDIKYLKSISDMINKYERSNKIVINKIYKTLDTHLFTDLKPLSFRKYVDRHIKEDFLINLSEIISKKLEK